MTETRRRAWGYLTAFAVIAVDQLTKYFALTGLELHRPVEVLGDLLRFTLAWNRGAAFSMGWGGPIVLSVVTAAASVFVAVMIWRLRAPRLAAVVTAGLGAVLGGALGNLIDRLIHGQVLDFIDIGISSRRWPTFNIADIAITIGGILLVLTYRKASREDCQEEQSDEC